ncbi:MAG: holo-ACP synthase [Candidatus Omnitrophica bacterium]|nr:holo-ACP synthase [Candidatus Omnitrophota bacterium]
MIIGTGIDIVEIDRFKKTVKKYGNSFLKKIFTNNEISYSKKRRFSNQHFAARFATKEAVLKAFGDNPGAIKKWTDIEVLNDKNGKPLVSFHGSAEKLRKRKKVDKVIVSMAHSRGHAVANAILIGGEK